MKKYIFIFGCLAICSFLSPYVWGQDIVPQIQKVLSIYDSATGQTMPYGAYIKKRQLEENRRHKSASHQYANHCFMQNGIRVCHPKVEDCYYYKFGRRCWPKQELGSGLPEPMPEPSHRHYKRRVR